MFHKKWLYVKGRLSLKYPNPGFILVYFIITYAFAKVKGKGIL
jgi:hypothetical protein